MNIDWKHLAKTPGYRSLKAAYCKDALKAGLQKHPMRSKEELYKEFRKIIGVAQNNALHKNVTIESVLNEWEEKRKGWWLGFYCNNHNKMHSCSIKPQGINGLVKYYKKVYKSDPKKGMERIKVARLYASKRNSLKTNSRKPRWSSARKKRGY